MMGKFKTDSENQSLEWIQEKYYNERLQQLSQGFTGFNKNS